MPGRGVGFGKKRPVLHVKRAASRGEFLGHAGRFFQNRNGLIGPTERSL